MILPHLDVEGRIEADPMLIKGHVLPLLKWSSPTIQKCLEELHNAELVTLYDVDGDCFLQYERFNDFQIIRKDRESESIIPPPGELQENSRRTPALSKVKLSKRESKIQSKGKGEFPPTSVMVTDYAKEINYQLDGNKFCDYYAARCWKLKGGMLMKDWRAAVRTWKRRDDETPKPETGYERIKRIQRETDIENEQRRKETENEQRRSK